MRPVMVDGKTPYLPVEIIRSILKRLPVKYLIRLQCVCKDWKNLFKTSSFMAEYLHHGHQNSFLLFECYSKYDPLNLSLVDREMRIRKIQNALKVSARIVHPSNGLLCVRLHDATHSLLVYNLAIKEVTRIPKPLNPVSHEFCVRFGFSATLNDYKIVRVCIPLFEHLIYGVEVFSRNTGLWKKTEVENLKGVTLLEVDGFTINETIFWFGSKTGVAKEDENDHDLIVSFDFTIEEFTLIPMPPVRSFSYNTNFTVYENKLAVLCPIGNLESFLVELWVMEEGASASEYGEGWSWTKKYTSNSYPVWLQPRTIWRNEIVCSSETATLLINLTTNEFNTFGHHVSDRYHCMFNHVESLLSVDIAPNEEL